MSDDTTTPTPILADTGPPGDGAAAVGVETTRAALRSRRGSRVLERGVEGILFLCAAVSIATTVAIIALLVGETAEFLAEISVFEFLFGTQWTPLFEPRRFGVLPLVAGTALVAVGAAFIALPLGLSAAIYLSEYAGATMRSLLKPALEVLAGIPTVVYGYFALTAVTPALQWLLMDWCPRFAGFSITVQFFNAASAAIVVGIMILPMVASLSDDALRAVPRSLRDAGYALGATKFEVSVRVAVPGALSGILASFLLAIARAIGETMAVTLAAGATPKFTLNGFESVQTMTAYIVQVSLGDTPSGTIEYRTIFAVGLLLFLSTLLMNILANRILKRFREVYE